MKQLLFVLGLLLPVSHLAQSPTAIRAQIQYARQQLKKDSFYSPAYRTLALSKSQLRYVADTFPEKPLLTFELYETYLEVINGMIASTVNPESKQATYQNRFPDFEAGIRAAQQLYQVQQDDQYLQWAFQTAEQNRNLLLAKSLYTPQQIPDSLESELGKLLGQINISKSKWRLARTDRDFAKAIQLENIRDSLTTVYNQLIATLDTQMPFEVSDTSEQSLDFQTIQQKLKPNEAFVEYFCGSNDIYAFVFTAHSKQMIHLGPSSLVKRQVDLFYRPFISKKSLGIALVVNSTSFYFNHYRQSCRALIIFGWCKMDFCRASLFRHYATHKKSGIATFGHCTIYYQITIFIIIIRSGLGCKKQQLPIFRLLFLRWLLFLVQIIHYLILSICQF